MSQAVLGKSEDGHTDLRINKVQGGPASRRDRGHELNLGSQDLVRFAEYASEHGFKIASFMIAESNLNPLSREENDETSDSMLQILARFGMRELSHAMSDEFDGLFVVGVNLIDKSSGKRIGVRRHGFVETSAVQQAEELLRSAWRELHLS